MESPKNNRNFNGYRLIGVGVIAAFGGLVAICTGRISMGGRWESKVTFSLTQNPLLFWVSVSLSFVAAAIFLLWGFTERK